MIPLGEAARFLRQELGLSQRAAAKELGMSHVHLNNIENAKASPSPDVIEKYFETWGIDLYMLAVGMFTDHRKLPQPLKAPMRELTTAWREHLKSVIEKRKRKTEVACSEFDD